MHGVHASPRYSTAITPPNQSPSVATPTGVPPLVLQQDRCHHCQFLSSVKSPIFRLDFGPSPNVRCIVLWSLRATNLGGATQRILYSFIFFCSEARDNPRAIA